MCLHNCSTGRFTSSSDSNALLLQDKPYTKTVSSMSMESFDDLLRQAELAHGHLCAGQILGVRLAMLGCQRLGIDEPRTTDRKRLVTFVEIDRCATDAIAVVTGCRLGKRALKFRDWGKMAATFVDLNAPLDPVPDSPTY